MQCQMLQSCPIGLGQGTGLQLLQSKVRLHNVRIYFCRMITPEDRLVDIRVIIKRWKIYFLHLVDLFQTHLMWITFSGFTPSSQIFDTLS